MTWLERFAVARMAWRDWRNARLRARLARLGGERKDDQT